MGWNFTVAKGGSIGSVIALWTVAMLYVMIVMMNTEMGSVMPEAGGTVYNGEIYAWTFSCI